MLRIPLSETARSLREFLEAANYHAPALSSELYLENGLYANLENMPGLRRKTAGTSLLSALARLFFVGLPLALDLCRAVIPDQTLEDFVSSGLLRVSGEEVIPEAILVPHGRLFLAADISQNRPGNPEMVMGASGSTRLLAGALLQGNVESCLDVGCGNGVLTLEAAEFSGHVTGIDINKRAVEFAKFNAAFNAIPNTTFLAGDTFGPVEGQKFSQIICNPPFLIGPTQMSAYCDSPLELDGFSRHLAMQAPAFLEEGGYFQMLCEWVVIVGESWEERLGEWTANSGCDVLVVTGTRLNPVDYAERRHIEAKQIHGQEPEGSLLERLTYFEQHNVRLIQGGIVTMRKRAGKNWFSIINTDATPVHAGNAVRERFEALTYVASHSPDELLQAKLRLAEGAELEQRSGLGADGMQTRAVQLIQNGGLKDSLRLDEVVANFVGLFDGTRTVDEIAASVSKSLDWTLEEARNHCLALARRLLQGGFVKPL